MAFSHTERRHLADVERHLATADTCIDAPIELLQRMPIFGGIRADVLQFLLGRSFPSPRTSSFSANTTKPIRCSSLKRERSLW
jgi:hypothetical protein